MNCPTLKPLSRDQSDRLKKLRQKRRRIALDKQHLINLLLKNKISVSQYHSDAKDILKRERDIVTELRELRGR